MSLYECHQACSYQRCCQLEPWDRDSLCRGQSGLAYHKCGVLNRVFTISSDIDDRCKRFLAGIAERMQLVPGPTVQSIGPRRVNLTDGFQLSAIFSTAF